MRRLRERDGFTLVELMFIVAIVGIMATLAVTSLKTYARREDTRTAARAVAGVVEKARSVAVSSGHMTWVVFDEPVNGVAPFEAGQFAAMIVDNDNDLQPTAADGITPIFMPEGARQHTQKFDSAASPYGATNLPDSDQSQEIPNGALQDTVDGSTLNIDVNLGVPTIGFSPQGFPVKASTPLQPGSGAGGIYMTDNNSTVVAVLVMPLGEVRTVAFDSASHEWK